MNALEGFRGVGVGGGGGGGGAGREEGEAFTATGHHLVADSVLPPILQSCLQVGQLLLDCCQLLLAPPAFLTALPQLSLMVPMTKYSRMD